MLIKFRTLFLAFNLIFFFFTENCYPGGKFRMGFYRQHRNSGMFTVESVYFYLCCSLWLFLTIAKSLNVTQSRICVPIITTLENIWFQAAVMKQRYALYKWFYVWYFSIMLRSGSSLTPSSGQNCTRQVHKSSDVRIRDVEKRLPKLVIPLPYPRNQQLF